MSRLRAAFFMRKLDLYISQQLLAPMTFGTIVALLLLVAERLFKFLPVLVQARIPLGPFGEALAHLLPAFAATAVPIALFMSSMLVAGKLVRSGEWGAILASGTSPWRASMAVVVLAIGFAGVAEYAVWQLTPKGREYFGKQVARLIATNAHNMLSANVPHRLPGGIDLMFEGKDGAAWLKPVFRWERFAESVSAQVVYAGAERAHVSFDEKDELWSFLLVDGWIWTGGKSPYIQYDELSLKTNPFGRIGRSWTGIEESDYSALLRHINEETNLKRQALVEMHARFASGIMLLVLPLAAFTLGLGSGNARSFKGEALLRGMLLFGAYYVAATAAQKLARSLKDVHVAVPIYGFAVGFALICLGMYIRRMRRG